MKMAGVLTVIITRWKYVELNEHTKETFKGGGFHVIINNDKWYEY